MGAIFPNIRKKNPENHSKYDWYIYENHKRLKMKKRILFLVNGYGLGNSTRIHAIIQNLNSDFQVDVFSYGNGLRYFKNVSKIDRLFEGPSLEYGIKNGKIDFWQNIKKVKKNIDSLLKSRKIIKQILTKRRPHLILTDSCFAPMFIKNRPFLISISSVDRTVEQALKIKKQGRFCFICHRDYGLYMAKIFS